MTPEALTEVEMITVVIDGFEVTVPKGTLIIRAAEKLGIQIPRFCDHPLLAPAGACRQCLVDVEINGRAFPKPQASCTIPVENNMIVKTQLTSPVAEKAQKGIMELLLINHPLDCPVCDKGGECPLQNQAMSTGRGESRYEGVKRTFEKPVAISTQVLLDRERCVLCARCTRFSDQIAGDPFITLNERGALQQVGIYEKDPFESYYSGNTVQICPVGALTGASYRFRSRPFDLVSTPSACEHCASGCAIRTDVRRGKTLRRLAGEDASVNEEWNCDKGRWAFKYLSSKERITTPLLRGADGELHEASWPEALAAAALALKGKRVGLLVGGRATVEDAYAYSKFARVTLGTNDIDFRARSHSDEEANFLATAALSAKTTYFDIDKADKVVLLGFEPEDESPIVFLRIFKQVRKRSLPVVTVAAFASRGSQKLKATFIPVIAGAEAAAISALEGLTEKSVVLVGERLNESAGALSAVVELISKSKAKLGWIPRRAGEPGALRSGAIANLLPGGRPVSDPAARVDVAAAWGVESLPTTAGRSTSQILVAAAAKELDAVVVAGVDPLDISAEALSQLLNTYVLSFEIAHSAVTAIADVVLPVAAITEKSGSFLDWEGRPRAFAKALEDSLTRSDLRILSMLADEMGAPINLPSVAAAAREIAALGNWDGAPAKFTPTKAGNSPKVAAGEAVLSSWRLLLDLGTLQAGEANLAGTARPATANISQGRADELGVAEGELVTVSSARGSITLPAHITAMADGSVWLARNSDGSQTISTLGIVGGEVVSVVKS
ncbi:MAG: NADH-quinone oxidoreductase subunit G [Actinomycetes bacterium]